MDVPFKSLHGYALQWELSEPSTHDIQQHSCLNLRSPMCLRERAHLLHVSPPQRTVARTASA